MSMRGDFEIGTMIADSAPDDARTHLRACVRACEELTDDAAWVFGHSAAVALHRLDVDPATRKSGELGTGHRPHGGAARMTDTRAQGCVAP